jgi:hypothetical protein
MKNEKSNKHPEAQLFTIGGILGLACALMYLITLAVFVPVTRAGTSPTTVSEWLAFLGAKPLIGLFLLGLADVVIMILWVPMGLALYEALKDECRAWAKIAIATIIVGAAVYLATNTAFSMLSLSRELALAKDGLQTEAILAAGQSLIAVSKGTGGQYAGMPLAWLGGLILSVIMLRSPAFGKANGWVGILGLGLLIASIPFAGYTTTGTPSPLVDAIITITYVGGGLLSLVWYILTGLRLLKLGRGS